MFRIAFAPEIRERISDGRIGENFVLLAAQLLQREEGKRRLVRLNEEVRGIGMIRTSGPVQKGAPVFMSDIRDFVSFDLEENELDAGHFTAIWKDGGWFISFDFRIGRAKSGGMLAAASEFLEASKLSADNGLARPSVDNLFSACELVSKAHLILHHLLAAGTKSHRAIGSSINRWRKLGNIDEGFVSLYNRMQSARPSARYDAAVQVDQPAMSDFEAVEREILRLKEYIAPAYRENRRKA